MTNLRIVKPATEAQRTTRTTTDCWEVTPDSVTAWKSPPFQRPLKVNDKVRQVAVDIKADDGVIPGILTLGVLDKVVYLLDGQHRREAFLISECLTGYVDVRIAHYASMAEMAEEFWKLNSRLVQMKPDDVLRALESGSAALLKLRKRCSFIGYDQLRRNPKSPMISMSAALRCWVGATPEVPTSAAVNAVEAANRLTLDEADVMIDFFELAINAWGRDPEYSRLWLALNLTICMWLYRRLVITPYSSKTTKLTKEQFGTLLMALSADPQYLAWLVGRQMRISDRSPCYVRVKGIFAARLEAETGRKQYLPSPDWASSKRGAGGGA
jgi:hypothetical protein